jgi:ABC-2 type transport system ATP-binding protein
MPERVSFPPEMRVIDYLRFAAEARGIPRRQRASAIETALGHARLDDVARRIVNNLSKGYRQRVGLAQALLADPPILILDEPSAGLDPLNVIEMREALRGYGNDRVVLVSTHILPETRVLCDRVLVMSQGRLVFDGATTAMAAGGTTFTVRVRAGGPQSGPPDVAMDDVTLQGCTAVGGDYDLVVDAPDDGSVGRFVGRLGGAGWLVVRVEATGDTLEDAFRRAVLGAKR